MAGRVVRVGQKDQRGLFVAGSGQGVQVEGEIRSERRLAKRHAAKARLLHVDGETRGKGHHVVDARPAGDAHEQVDDLVGAVAGHHTFPGHAVGFGQGRHQGGIAGPGIAEDHVGLAGQHAFDQGRGPEGIFIAGQLDHVGQAVPFLDLFHGQSGSVGRERTHFLPDPVAWLHGRILRRFVRAGRRPGGRQAQGARRPRPGDYAASRGLMVNTGQSAALTTFSATEPKMMRSMPVRPWVPMMIMSACCSAAALRISSAG